jgi:hypothetical protein
MRSAPRTPQPTARSSASRTLVSATHGRQRSREGGLIGVRAPLHESEAPVVRPYWLVADIEAALRA